MNNQGKVAKKQRQNYVYVFLHNSILSFFFERKLTVYGETLFLHLLVFLSPLSQTLVYLSEKRKCYFVARTAKTLSNHSVLIIKKRNSNQYAHNNRSIGSKTLVNPEKGFLYLHDMVRLQMWNQNGNIKINSCFTTLLLCKFSLITHNSPLIVNSLINVHWNACTVSSQSGFTVRHVP